MELFILLTRGMVNQRMDSCCLLSRTGGASARACSVHPVPKVLSLDTQGCTATTFSQYIILCASRGQQALNGSVLLLVMAYLT